MILQTKKGRRFYEELDDSRFIYKPNIINFGRARNLDQAFQSESYGDSEYAFVLEDDNYLYPHFIERGISNIKSSGANICMINQEVRFENDGISTPLGNITSRGRWFQTKVYEPIDLYARLFYCEGISNGGLFWRTSGIRSNLQIGAWMRDSWQQEVLRTIQIRESIYFESEPLAVWTFFPQVPANPFSSFLSSPSKFSRMTQHLLIELYKKYGDSFILLASNIASNDEDHLDFERQLLNMLIINYEFSYIKMPERLFLLVRNTMRYYLFGKSFKKILSVISLGSDSQNALREAAFESGAMNVSPVSKSQFYISLANIFLADKLFRLLKIS